MMLGHQYQGIGYGVPVLQAVIDSMVQTYKCEEIFLSVIHDNERAKRIYEKWVLGQQERLKKDTIQN